MTARKPVEDNLKCILLHVLNAVFYYGNLRIYLRNKLSKPDDVMETNDFLS